MKTVLAVRHVRRMRGGAQSHLLRCSDGHLYVVKFRNNPQHVRVLANELLASELAAAVGLPIPASVLVEVSSSLVCNSPELNIVLPGQTIPCEPGLHFGSRYAVDPMFGSVVDWLPGVPVERVRNLRDFAGMLVVDKWTGNADGRQVVFWRAGRQRKYAACFVDHGYCFNAGEWTFPDHPLRGVFALNEAYNWITSWESFEPWLSRVETLAEERIWEIAGEIPPEWYGADWGALEELGLALIERRRVVRDLIRSFQISVRRPFPRWMENLGAESRTVDAGAHVGSWTSPGAGREFCTMA